MIQQLTNPEFRFIKVKSKEKIPMELGWQKEKNYSYADSELTQHIVGGGNFGVATGFGDLVVIDSDHEETQKIVEKVLPGTFRVKTRNGTHNYFICKDLKKKIVLTEDVGGKHYGEVQTKGQQVVAPGSVHPSGSVYEVISDQQIVEITQSDIVKALEPLMKQTRDVVKSFKANVGNRNDTLFRMVCSFRSRNIAREEAIVMASKINEGNVTPLGFKEVETIVNSAYKYVAGSGVLKVNNYLDNVNLFAVENPFFYDRAKMFWMWNKKKYMWEIVDETDLMNMIEEALSFRGETISRTIKGDYLEAFKRVGRKITPKDAPKRWVQFKDKAISLRTGNIYSVTPDYFFCNPIPWDIGESEETPVLDKLFEEWVGKEYVKTLYEIIAYCCYGDYPIQLLFCLVGSGRNGKSCFLKILSNFLGTHNICSTELDSLVGINKSRFETFKLFKKLGCIMGETNFGRMSTSGMLKKLTGGDLVSYEKKGKDAFDANNYAKLLISTNSLPTCEDTSEGFYRRWVIIDFPNNFPEGKDIVESVPEGEYKNLACKVTKLLPKLLESGTITNQGTLDERREKYISASNPLTFFLDSCCTIHTDAYVSCNDLFGAYCRYLHLNKRRRVGRKEFYLVLSDEGYFHRRADKNGEKDYFFEGVMLNNDWEKCCKVNPTKTTKTTVVSNSIPYIENELENNVVCVENVGKIFIKCNFCGKDESNGYTASGKPVCSDCMKQLEVNGEKVY